MIYISVWVRLANMLYKAYRESNPIYTCACGRRCEDVRKVTCRRCESAYAAAALAEAKRNTERIVNSCSRCGDYCGGGGVVQEDNRLLCVDCDSMVVGGDYDHTILID